MVNRDSILPSDPEPKVHNNATNEGRSDVSTSDHETNTASDNISGIDDTTDEGNDDEETDTASDVPNDNESKADDDTSGMDEANNDEETDTASDVPSDHEHKTDHVPAPMDVAESDIQDARDMNEVLYQNALHMKNNVPVYGPEPAPAGYVHKPHPYRNAPDFPSMLDVPIQEIGMFVYYHCYCVFICLQKSRLC